MLVSLKKQKNAKSGLPHRRRVSLSLQLLVPMTFRAPMPHTSGTAANLIARFIRADRKLQNHGVRAGNPELSAFAHRLSTIARLSPAPQDTKNPQMPVDNLRA
jgi:predicted RNA polymerase sigma factor